MHVYTYVFMHAFMHACMYAACIYMDPVLLHGITYQSSEMQTISNMIDMKIDINLRIQKIFWMSISLLLFVYMYTKIDGVFSYGRTNVCIHVDMYVYIYVCTHIHVCMYIYTCIYIYTYTCIYMYVYMYIYTCIY